MELMPAYILGGALLALLAVRVPIALAMLLASGIYLLGFGTIPMTVLPQRLWAGLESFPLLAIPFFVFAGILMNVSGAPSASSRSRSRWSGSGVAESHTSTSWRA